MASFTTTTHAVFIPEVWAKEVQLAREDKLVMANRVDRFDLEFANGGDILHVPKIANLSAADISTSDGSLADSAPTETEVTLTVDKWKGIKIDIIDLVTAQSRYDLMAKYAEKMGFGLALAVDDDLMALYATLSQDVGTAGVDITDAVFRSGVQKLDEANAPMEDRHAVLHPEQKNALLGIDKFVRYDALGSANSIGIRKGDIGELYGVTTLVSTNVGKTASERENIMWQKSAFALAMVKQVKIEKFARTKFSQTLGSSELYGVAEMRDDHALKLKS